MVGNMNCPRCNTEMKQLDVLTCEKCGMRICPQCGMGIEWGRLSPGKYFWRCNYCNYKKDIYE